MIKLIQFQKLTNKVEELNIQKQKEITHNLLDYDVEINKLDERTMEVIICIQTDNINEIDFVTISDIFKIVLNISDLEIKKIIVKCDGNNKQYIIKF